MRQTAHKVVWYFISLLNTVHLRLYVHYGLSLIHDRDRDRPTHQRVIHEVKSRHNGH